MVVCPVVECGKEFKDNSGLASHMNLIHHLRTDGSTIPAEQIERRRQRIANRHKELAKTHRGHTKGDKVGWHSPEARVKAIAGIRAAKEKKRKERLALAKAVDDAVNAHAPTRDTYYAKLAARGIFRCQRCAQEHPGQKAIDFTRAVDLGKHMRFAHGVPGRNHKVRETGEQKCPHCERTFSSFHGLRIHQQMHKDKPSTALVQTPIDQELIHANGSAERTVHAHQEQSRSHSHDGALAEVAVAVARAIGYVENYILATALSYDISAREFARRLVIALGEHYS